MLWLGPPVGSFGGFVLTVLFDMCCSFSRFGSRLSFLLSDAIRSLATGWVPSGGVAWSPGRCPDGVVT
jgi:hypothetical protein